MNKVTLWHPTRTDAAQSGIRRYEQVLDGCDADGWTTAAVRRPAHPVRGATLVSWALDYRQLGADVIHATAATAGVPALARRGAPLIVTSHGPIPVRYPELQRDWTTKLQWAAQPRVLRRADAVIANSRFTKRELVDVYGIDASKVHVVHLGVDLQRFRPVSRGDGPLADREPAVLIVSSNLPQKRMDIARAVIERLPDIEFYKAGYGEALAGLDNVTNLGWVAESTLPVLYAHADLLFHPSEYESFGLPLLEAMACGTPVVAQDRTAMAEVVGEGGLLVEPLTAVDGFVKAIRRVLLDGAGLVARRQAERFPWSKTAAKTVDVWKGVLDRQ